MKRFLICGATAALLTACSGEPADPLAAYRADAEQMAQKYLIADTHIDVPYRLQDEYEDVTQSAPGGDFDLPRASAGGLNLPFMSIYIPARYEREGGAVELADELIDMVEAVVASAPEKMMLAASVGDVDAAFGSGRMAIAMGMENGAPIAGSLDNLQHFYDRGVRYVTLAHSESNHIADSSYDLRRRWKGLSPFGRELVVAMNEIGMMIDVSHISDDAFYQVADLTAAPVIASHSSVRSFTPGWERNMDDDMIKRLAEIDGVIHINFGSSFISERSRQNWEELRGAR